MNPLLKANQLLLLGIWATMLSCNNAELNKIHKVRQLSKSRNLLQNLSATPSRSIKKGILYINAPVDHVYDEQSKNIIYNVSDGKRTFKSRLSKTTIVKVNTPLLNAFKASFKSVKPYHCRCYKRPKAESSGKIKSRKILNIAGNIFIILGIFFLIVAAFYHPWIWTLDLSLFIAFLIISYEALSKMPCS